VQESKEGPEKKAEGESAMSEQKEQQPVPISPEQLSKILHQHRIWLSYRRQKGRRADLSGVNLQKANLYQALLVDASLANTKFIEANLRAANLEGADLNEADMDNANLEKANFRNTTLNNIINLHTANLHYCNFEGATGLTRDEFARADITGARLPDGIRDFKMLTIVDETSRNAIKIFIATLLSCVYSWLTIGSTTDVALLTNSSATPLPIIQTAIPIASFYMIAPLLLIALYFYLHFYLQRLWGALATLPAIFEDGRSLDQRAYPWLLNGLVRRHFGKLRCKRNLVTKLEEIVVIILAWCLVPFTLCLFWLRYIPRHDWPGTGFQIALIVISIAAGVYFYHLHTQTLQGKNPESFSLKTIFRDKRTHKLAGVIIVGAIAVWLSMNSINIDSRDQFILFRALGYNIFADFREKDVSARPENYWLILPAYRDSAVAGARLVDADLSHADATNAFLLHADLRKSILIGARLDYAKLNGARLDSAILDSASLRFASLVGAEFFGANLRWTDLSGANLDSVFLADALLQNANLRGTMLQSANLYRANLDSAVLDNAWLVSADLSWANLRGASLMSANLDSAILDSVSAQGANFSKVQLRWGYLNYANLDSIILDYAWLVGVNLSKASLRGASIISANLDSAILDSALIQGSNLSGAWMRGVHLCGTNLDSALLCDARLKGADLSFAKLRGANLSKASLDLANLSGADLSTVINLTQKQLDGARGDSLTKLPPGLHIKSVHQER
jgi:uncharacterized protein YjbI with pentapeptide repeats